MKKIHILKAIKQLPKLTDVDRKRAELQNPYSLLSYDRISELIAGYNQIIKKLSVGKKK